MLSRLRGTQRLRTTDRISYLKCVTLYMYHYIVTAIKSEKLSGNEKYVDILGN